MTYPACISLYRDVWSAAIASSRKNLTTLSVVMCNTSMKITFVTRKFRNGQRNVHCDVVRIPTKWVFGLTLDCNGVFAIKAYGWLFILHQIKQVRLGLFNTSTLAVYSCNSEHKSKVAAKVNINFPKQ